VAEWQAPEGFQGSVAERTRERNSSRADAGHGAGAGIEGLGDAVIRPTVEVGICFEQDAGTGNGGGRVICEPARPLQVGDFRITAYPVDHSAFDSMAFLIEAEGKTLLYSGDLRLHGRKPGMARRLIEALSGRRVDLLLMEGTHVGSGRERGVTEHELEDLILCQLQESQGLVLASFSPLHVDRLVTFYKAARRGGRTFVVDPYGAFVMHLVSGQCRIPRPTQAAGIRVYHNAYFEASYQRRNLGKIHRLFAALAPATARRSSPCCP
jgi:hypothetical protein